MATDIYIKNIHLGTEFWGGSDRGKCFTPVIPSYLIEELCDLFKDEVVMHYNGHSMTGADVLRSIQNCKEVSL